MLLANTIFSRIASLFFLWGIFLTSASAADPWYENNPSCVIDRGNPARTGEYFTKSLKQPAGILWNDYIGGETPLVCHKNLIIGGGPSVMQMDNGKMLWHTSLQLWGAGSTVYKNLLYATVDFGKPSASLLGFEINTGKIVRQSNGQEGVHTSTFSPLVYNDMVYYNSGFSVVAYNIIQNKMAWQYRTSNDTSPIATDGKKVYFTDWTDKVYALDMRTGQLVWSTPKVVIGNNYLTVYKNKIFAYGEKLYVLDAQTGAILQSHTIQKPYADSLAISDDKIYLRNADGILFALDANNGKILWKNACGAISSTSIAENIAYVISYTDLIAIDKNSGKTLWKYPLPAKKESGINTPTEPYIMPYDGKVFVADIYKHVIAFH